MEYDESTNPSNGWHVPDELERDELLDNIENNLRELDPCETNPLDSNPLPYNPLNHSYPMIADTKVGVVEAMIKFVVVRGQHGLADDMLKDAPTLQIRVSIEDIQVPFWTQDGITENALIDTISNDCRYYLVPTIVRARRLASGEVNNTDTWELLSEEETVSLFSWQTLLDLIVGYASKVAGDPDAPAALLDMLQHFTGRYGPSNVPDVSDDEWNNTDESLN
jgi:hypothetical protein